MVDHRNFDPVVNHYRWFVETLAHIASIYLFANKAVLCGISISYFWKNVKYFYFGLCSPYAWMTQSANRYPSLSVLKAP